MEAPGSLPAGQEALLVSLHAGTSPHSLSPLKCLSPNMSTDINATWSELRRKTTHTAQGHGAPRPRDIAPHGPGTWHHAAQGHSRIPHRGAHGAEKSRVKHEPQGQSRERAAGAPDTQSWLGISHNTLGRLSPPDAVPCWVPNFCSGLCPSLLFP